MLLNSHEINVLSVNFLIINDGRFIHVWSSWYLINMIITREDDSPIVRLAKCGLCRPIWELSYSHQLSQEKAFRYIYKNQWMW